MAKGRPLGRREGRWTPEEDAILKDFIQKNANIGNWTMLPRRAGLQRCGKSCRLRWVNYLKPGINQGSFTEEEEKTIIDLHGRVGHRWSLIAEKLPGRTNNQIKNYWKSRLEKKIAQKSKVLWQGDRQRCACNMKMFYDPGPVPAKKFLFSPWFHARLRAYQSTVLPTTATSLPGHLPQDAVLRPTHHHQMFQHFEQQRVHGYEAQQEVVSAVLSHRRQQLEQLHQQEQEQELPVTVKIQFVDDLPPSDMTPVRTETQIRDSTCRMNEVPDNTQRVGTFESDLNPEVRNASTSTVILNENVDVLHHPSPTLDWSSCNLDDFLGVQLNQEAPYNITDKLWHEDPCLLSTGNVDQNCNPDQTPVMTDIQRVSTVPIREVPDDVMHDHQPPAFNCNSDTGPRVSSDNDELTCPDDSYDYFFQTAVHEARPMFREREEADFIRIDDLWIF